MWRKRTDNPKPRQERSAPAHQGKEDPSRQLGDGASWPGSYPSGEIAMNPVGALRFCRYRHPFLL